MLLTPAYIFTILLGIWVLSLIGCIVLGIFCYRLVVDRRQLRLRLERLSAEPPLVRLEGLAAGAYLSDIALPLVSSVNGSRGEIVSLADLIASASQPKLLIFLDRDCLFSRALARELSASTAQSNSPVVIAVIGGEPPGASDFPPLAGTLLSDPHRQAAPLYGVAATPVGYLVAPTRHTIGAVKGGPLALLHAFLGNATQDQPRSPLSLTPIPQNADSRRSQATNTA